MSHPPHPASGRPLPKGEERAPAGPPKAEAPDLREKGGPKAGAPQALDRRLFIQLTAFGGCADPAPLAGALAASGARAALYEDLNDPRGVAVAAASEDPGFFAGPLRRLFNSGPFAGLTPKTAYAMLGRTYSIGYEPDLEDWLVAKPQRTLLNPAWPWAVWYPLRRTGAFSRLPAEEQRQILKEHGAIGFAFGDADHAHDIRLACHGLDQSDNDFVIGLTGKALYPLSALVQAMRRTVQTSTYIEKMGPFFVGRAAWQAAL